MEPPKRNSVSSSTSAVDSAKSLDEIATLLRSQELAQQMEGLKKLNESPGISSPQLTSHSVVAFFNLETYSLSQLFPIKTEEIQVAFSKRGLTSVLCALMNSMEYDVLRLTARTIGTLAETHPACKAALMQVLFCLSLCVYLYFLLVHGSRCIGMAIVCMYTCFSCLHIINIYIYILLLFFIIILS